MQTSLCVFCDAANVSAEGKLNILGEFNAIGSHSYPLVYPALTLVLRLEAETLEMGSHELRLRLIDPDGIDIVEPLDGSFELGLSNEPGLPSRTHPIILNLMGVTFHKPGIYAFQVHVNDQLVESTSLLLNNGLLQPDFEEDDDEDEDYGV